MKKLIAILTTVLGLGSLFAVTDVLNVAGAPDSQQTRSIYPATNDLYYIGSTSLAYKQGTFTSLCLTGDDCVTTWPTGGSASLSGGSANTLTYWTSGTEVGATSSPTVGYITATSTTGTSSLYGYLNIGKDLGVSTDGATEASPRVFGLTNLSSGEAARFQFGDEHNALQKSYAKDQNLYSYWALVLTGGRQNFSTNFQAMPFSKTTNVGVLVKADSYLGNDPASDGTPIDTLGIMATTSQWTNLTSWRDPNGATMSLVDYLGHFTIGSNATSSYALNVAGTTNLLGAVSMGTVASGTWNGTAIADAYVADDITATNYLSLSALFASSTLPKTNVANSWSSLQTYTAGSGNIVSGTGAAAAGLLVQESGNGGVINFGNNTAAIGVSSDGVVAGYNYNGTYMFRQLGTNPTEDVEFLFIEEGGDWRFALPKSGAGLGTYNPRSFIIAGPATNTAGNVRCSSWGFTAIDCNTSGTGADLGVQDDMQVLGNGIFGGNVGIGTTSPYAKLSVTGDVVADRYVATSTTASSSFQAITATAFGVVGKFFADATRFVVSVAASFTDRVTFSGAVEFFSSFAVGTSTNPTMTNANNLAINTTAASSSVRYYDGTAERVLSPIVERSFSFASSTLTYMGAFGAAGTTTILLSNYDRPITLTDIYCKTNAGTTSIQFTDGTNATDLVMCGPNGAEDDGTIANNTWVRREDFKINIGSSIGTPSNITVTVGIRSDAD